MALLTPPAAARLIDEFLRPQTEHTRRAYAQDLADFAVYCKVNTAAEAVCDLIKGTAPRANELVEKYKTQMVKKRGLAPSTVQRRLSTMREIVKYANKVGHVLWLLQVDNKVSQSKKDARMRTRAASLAGPPPELISKMRAILASSGSVVAIRDLAMFDLAIDIAGRRSEITELNVSDVDLKAKTVSIVGKGRSTSEDCALPQRTVASLKRWLGVRPGAPRGPLFVRLDPGKSGTPARLTGTSFYRMIRKLGAKVGLEQLHPHSLRHSSITEAVEYSAENGISLDQVMQFSRHKSLETLIRYRDKRKNHQKTFADAVAIRTS